MRETPSQDMRGELISPKRVNYFAGQLLSAADFVQEQDYIMGKDRRHSGYLHGHGVVSGLRVVPARPPMPRCIVVEPGLALDAWGREIVVPDATEFKPEDDAYPRCVTMSGRTETFFVVLEYRECATDPVPVSPPGTGDPETDVATSRILESFQLDFRREPPEAEESLSMRLCEMVADGIRQALDGSQLHALLCELVCRPGQSFAADPAVTLARVDVPVGSPITAAEIDNCRDRHLVLSTTLILQVLLCTLGGSR